MLGRLSVMLIQVMNPNQQNPYDFITNSPQPKKILIPVGNSTKARVMQVIIFGGILFIILFVAGSFIFGGRNKDIEALYQLSANQSDIISIAEQGVKDARNSQLVNQAAITSSTIKSHKAEVEAYLSKRNASNPKKVASLQNNAYQQTLEEALKNGNFEDVYIGIYNDRLNIYRSSLEVSYGEAKNAEFKKQLESFYSQLELLSTKQ